MNSPVGVKKNNGPAKEEHKSLRISMDMMGQLNYQDFNAVGDKNVVFDPSTLLRK